MNVAEFIWELEQIKDQTLTIRTSCPHCCGQPGTDLDILDPEYIRVMEQFVLLGDPGHNCLDDCRIGSRTRVRNSVEPVQLAQSLGLEYQKNVYWQTLKPEDPALYRKFRNIRQPDLLILASEDGIAQYIMVETPYRPTILDIEKAQRGARMLQEITGGPVRAVIAGVKLDPGLELPGDVAWYQQTEPVPKPARRREWTSKQPQPAIRPDPDRSPNAEGLKNHELEHQTRRD